MSAPALVTDVQLTQLYQALDWLQPPLTAPAQQQSAWSSLQDKMHRLGPRPASDKPPFHGNRKLCAALNQLQPSFKAMVVIQSYWVPAVLQLQDNKAQPVMLRLSTPDYINNTPGRLCTTAPLLIMPALASVCLIAPHVAYQWYTGRCSVASTVCICICVEPLLVRPSCKTTHF